MVQTAKVKIAKGFARDSRQAFKIGKKILSRKTKKKPKRFRKFQVPQVKLTKTYKIPKSIINVKL